MTAPTQSTHAPSTLGNLLLGVRAVDEMQLASALAHQRRWGGKLGDILIEHQFCDEELVYQALAHQFGLKLALSLARPTPHADAALGAAKAQHYRVLPMAVQERVLFVATDKPRRLDIMDEIGFITGLRVQPVLTPTRVLEWAHRAYYRGDSAPCPPPSRARRFSAS